MALCEEPCAVSGYGVEFARSLDLSVVAVARGVVGGGMGSDPVGHGLDESWSLAGVGPGGRVASGLVYGQHVVPVDAHAGESVACRAFPYLSRGLRAGGHAYRPAVVLAE